MTTRHDAPRRRWLAVCVTVIATAVLTAADVRITPIVADGQVFATFAAPSAFTADVRRAVESGLPVTFTFTAELRRSSFWLDRTLGAAAVASTVKYDTLTGEYHVSKMKDGTVNWSRQTPKEDEMRAWMTEFERVPLKSATALDANADYYVRVRVRDSLPRGFSLWPWGRHGQSGRVELSIGR